jgi:sec-independent protein translocase protein TatA
MPFNLGPMEMMVVGLLAVLLFGKRLPEVGRSLGKGIVEFKKGIRGIEDELDSTNRAVTSATAETYRPVEPAVPSAPKFEPPSAPPTPVAGPAAVTENVPQEVGAGAGTSSAVPAYQD